VIEKAGQKIIVIL